MNKGNKKKLLVGLCISIVGIIIIGIIVGINISNNNRIANINQLKSQWKKEALISPAKLSLQAAGYITIEWNSAEKMDDVDSYEIYVDNKKEGEVQGNKTTFEYYTTKVSKHEVFVKANLKHGSEIYSDIFYFYVNKKGFCMNTDMASNVNADEWNVSWYYNWSLSKHNYTSFQDLEFVPMFWTSAPTDKNEVEVLPKRGYKNLLAFNEPDRPDQANISVDTAIEGMKPLLNKGIRVGSPAVSIWPSISTDWFQPFMKKMKENKMDVDFITLHHYWNWHTREGAEAFLKIVDESWEMYHKPIWITEFALSGVPDWTKQTRQSAINYMKIVLPELDKRDYVERYSWFSFSKSDFKNSGSALLDTYTGKITGLGELYQKLGIPEGYQDKKQTEQRDNNKKDIVK